MKKAIENMPGHIAFIMDGNGRWGTRRGLPRNAGHAKGAKVFKKIVKYCDKINIKTVTFYSFSSENWSRPEEEVSYIMRMFDKYMDDVLAEFTNYDIEVRFIGDLTKFEEYNPAMLAKIRDIHEKTSGKSMRLNIALNYGGRDEIVRAANAAFERRGGKALDAAALECELYTEGCPDPDLIIRTAGERRVSNFLLWQCAYSEFWFTDALWPDFTEKILCEAINDFSNRKRRYGGV